MTHDCEYNYTPTMKLLLLGNSKNRTDPYLAHAEVEIKHLFGNHKANLLFIPYAQALPSFDTFTATARKSFQQMGYELTSIHTSPDPPKAIREADGLVVGGGNTFFLLWHLYERNLLPVIQERVKSGTPFMGWSAGANIACATIKTTNDMPITEPRSLNALGFVPFQINPHYIDCSDNPTAETREERLTEFIEINPEVYVVALREGSMLRVEDKKIELIGPLGARIFKKGKLPQDYQPGEALDFLLSSPAQVYSVT
jgi:dipeptidase E